jgi:Flp pilus assembly protein TadD
LEHSLYLDSDFADAHMELASVLHQLGDHRAARMEFNEALRLKPGDVNALFNCGNLMRDMGDFKGAEKMYREVRKLRHDGR